MHELGVAASIVDCVPVEAEPRLGSHISDVAGTLRRFDRLIVENVGNLAWSCIQDIERGDRPVWLQTDNKQCGTPSRSNGKLAVV
jgi:hypothetical protein